MLKSAVKIGVGRLCSGIRCSSCSARRPQVELLAEIEFLGVLTWSRGGHKVHESALCGQMPPPIALKKGAWRRWDLCFSTDFNAAWAAVGWPQRSVCPGARPSPRLPRACSKARQAPSMPLGLGPARAPEGIQEPAAIRPDVSTANR